MSTDTNEELQPIVAEVTARLEKIQTTLDSLDAAAEILEPNLENLREYMKDANPDAVFWDDLDGAIIGVGQRCSQKPLVAYSIPKILVELEKQGMTNEEAREWYDFNIGGAWVGEGTPIHIEAFE